MMHWTVQVAEKLQSQCLVLVDKKLKNFWNYLCYHLRARQKVSHLKSEQFDKKLLENMKHVEKQLLMVVVWRIQIVEMSLYAKM